MQSFTRSYGELLGAPPNAPEAIQSLRQLCVREIVKAIRDSRTLELAAETLGVAPSTLRRWRSQYPELKTVPTWKVRRRNWARGWRDLK